MPTISLYMIGLDNTIRARDLATYLERTCGPIHRLDIPYTHKKQYAFVHFKDDKHAKIATDMRMFKIGMCTITISYSKFDKEHNMKDVIT